MKRLLYILSLLFCLQSFGQDSLTYFKMKSRMRYERMAFDTALKIPSVTHTPLWGKGWLRYNESDSSVYVWTGTQWQKTSGSGGVTDSSTFANTNLTFYANRTHNVNGYTIKIDSAGTWWAGTKYQGGWRAYAVFSSVGSVLGFRNADNLYNISSVLTNSTGAYLQYAWTSTNSNGFYADSNKAYVKVVSGKEIYFVRGSDTVYIPQESGTLAVKRYKSYVALLTQTGTSAPVATVLENDLGGTITWSRISDGYYEGTITGATFPANKTVVLHNTTVSPIGILVGAQRIGIDKVELIVTGLAVILDPPAPAVPDTTIVEWQGQDNILSNAFCLEIRVYY